MSSFELKIANIFVLSIPILLITGPFLADLALSLSYHFLFFIIRKRQFVLFKDNYFLFFLLFYTIVIISCLQSNFFEKIIFKNIFYF